MLTVTRRSLITSLGATLLCAPAIVCAASLMPVKAHKRETGPIDFQQWQSYYVIFDNKGGITVRRIAANWSAAL